jgi:hypothetical protein
MAVWSSKYVFLGKLVLQVGKSADSWSIDISFLAAVPELEPPWDSRRRKNIFLAENEAIPKARFEGVGKIHKAYEPRIAKSPNKSLSLFPAFKNKRNEKRRWKRHSQSHWIYPFTLRKSLSWHEFKRREFPRDIVTCLYRIPVRPSVYPFLVCGRHDCHGIMDSS